MMIHPTKWLTTFTISVGLVAPIAAYNTPALSANNVDPFPFQFLYEQCQSRSTFCFAYISGVGDMMWLNGQAGAARELSLCNTSEASRKAMTQVVVNYGQQHPEKWADSMVLTTALALRQTWPCP
jgi:Rap1a immunity proteins